MAEQRGSDSDDADPKSSGPNDGEGEARIDVPEALAAAAAATAAAASAFDVATTNAPHLLHRQQSLSHHQQASSSSSHHRPRSSTATTTLSHQGSRTSTLTPFYLLQDGPPSASSPLHLSSRPRLGDGVSARHHDGHDDDQLMAGGNDGYDNVDDDEQFEVDSQAGNSLYGGDSSTTDGIHVYSLSSHNRPRLNRSPSKLPTTVVSATHNAPYYTYYPGHPYGNGDPSRPCCPCCPSSGCLGRLEMWSGVVTNLHYKRLGLVSTAVCSLTLGLRTTDTIQQSEEAMAVVNQLVHGLLVVFTVQLALEVSHCAFELAAMLMPWATTTTAATMHDTAPQQRGMHSAETLSSRPRSPSRRKEVGMSPQPPPVPATTSRFFHLRIGFLLLDAVVIGLSWLYSDTVLVVRTFWLLKGLRRAPGISELRLLIHALAMAAPTLSALVAMLLVVLYVFSVLFCSFFGTLPYYDGLSTTSWTLFQLLTLDNWSEIAIHTNETYPHSWVLMVAFLGVAVFVGMSLLVAVMTLAVSNAYHERLRRSLLPDPSSRGGGGSAVVVDDREDLGLLKPHAPHLENASERTATTLTEPFLHHGDSVTGFSEGTAAASSRLLRLEHKVDAVAAHVQQMARLQASMHEILQRLKVE